MRKTKEASGALLAIALVLALVGFWTGWTGAISGWAAGHAADLINDSMERLTQ